jgi:RNA polymerase sigma factor FliA
MALEVLLVEHDIGFVLRVEQALRAFGPDARLHTAAVGNDAVDYLSGALERSTAPPDLILLDWDLPGERSHAILEQLREVPGANGIPVLVFSARTPERGTVWGRIIDDAGETLRSPALQGFTQRFLDLIENRGTSNSAPPTVRRSAEPGRTSTPTPAEPAARSSTRAVTRPSRRPSGPMLADLIENVRRTARRVCRSLPQTVRADAESAAMVGLVEALRHFGELENDHFQNYLKLRVRGAIRDEARRFDPLSRRLRELIGRIDKVAEAHRKEHGVDPDMDVVAKAIGVDEDRCWQAVELAEYHTLPIDDDTLSAPPHTAEDQFVESYAAAALRWALAKLSQRSRLVLRLWYRRGLTVAAIAARLEISISRVHQLRVEAERQLAKYLRHAPPMSDLGASSERFDWDDHTDEARSPAVAISGRKGAKVCGSALIRGSRARDEKASG